MQEDTKVKKLPRGLNDKRNKHQLMVTSIYNKLIMLHLSPQTGEIYIHELDPNMTFKYTNSILLTRGDVLHQMQVVDNLICVHNMDEKSSNMYDIKLAEYALPILVDNLDIETKYFVDTYHSDLIFDEEKIKEDKAEETDKFKSPGEIASGSKIKESKEYFEINFKFNYTGDEDAPIKVGIDLDGGQPDQKNIGQIDSNRNKSATEVKTDVYTDSLIFVEPMFMIDTKKYHNFTMKMNLDKII